ncbi:MAG: hypothetical protein J1E43_10675 [Christensenellaceae bacterium]|nr:hypothetical protein [Christensenellaceae bacterium]
MSKLTDKVSYLKGMADGMKLNMDKDANKLIMEILNALGEFAEEMQAVTDAHDELNEYVESIDDDLADLEETLFGDEEEDDEDDGEEEDDEIIAYACPECGHEIEFRAGDVDLSEDYLCPACGKPIFPEIEEDEAEDDEESPEE